jgi:hypothetical protein
LSVALAALPDGWVTDVIGLDTLLMARLERFELPTPWFVGMNDNRRMSYPYAANNLLDLVRKMFNWGKVAGFVPKDHANPAPDIPDRTPPRRVERPWGKGSLVRGCATANPSAPAPEGLPELLRIPGKKSLPMPARSVAA